MEHVQGVKRPLPFSSRAALLQEPSSQAKGMRMLKPPSFLQIPAVLTHAYLLSWGDATCQSDCWPLA